MMESIGVYGSPDLITKWWLLLSESEYQIEIKPPLNEADKSEKDELVYRQGFISKNGIKVSIITTDDALCPRSNHPLSGKPALFVGYGGWFKKTRLKKLNLAEEVVDLLILNGATRLKNPLTIYEIP